MYLLYVDESGRAPASHESYFVVSGVAIHEDDCYPFSRSLDSLQRRLLGAQYAELELHASRIWSARNEWARVPQELRDRLIPAVFRHVVAWTGPNGRKLIPFAVAVRKSSFPARDPVEHAHEELFARFDRFLTRLHHAGESHRSLVIADDSSYEQLVQRLTPQWKRGSGRMGKLHSLVEVPMYVDSKLSRLVQIADFVAWAAWHYYENRHTQWMQILNSAFDADGGVQHGVAHLTRGYRTCVCVACESRRTHAIKRVVPSLP